MAPSLEEPIAAYVATQSKIDTNLVAPEPGKHCPLFGTPRHLLIFNQSTAQAPSLNKQERVTPALDARIKLSALQRQRGPIPIFLLSPLVSPKFDTRS
jgi:hypothetical protein